MLAHYIFRFESMNTIKMALFSLVVCLIITACSSTTSDVHQVIEATDRTMIQDVDLEISAEGIQLTSQTTGSIFTLRQSKNEVIQVAKLVAQRYGFNVTQTQSQSTSSQIGPLNEEKASLTTADVAETVSVKTGFVMNIITAMPDGGACLEGISSAAKNLSYTGSVLTFGIAPASAEHCIVVTAQLYRFEDDDRVLVGEFTDNLGRVGLYAGANEIDNYQLNVDVKDEVRSLELSIGGLINKMLAEDAFVQEKNETFDF